MLPSDDDSFFGVCFFSGSQITWAVCIVFRTPFLGHGRACDSALIYLFVCVEFRYILCLKVLKNYVQGTKEKKYNNTTSRQKKRNSSD